MLCKDTRCILLPTQQRRPAKLTYKRCFEMLLDLSNAAGVNEGEGKYRSRCEQTRISVAGRTHRLLHGGITGDSCELFRLGFCTPAPFLL